MPNILPVSFSNATFCKCDKCFINTRKNLSRYDNAGDMGRGYSSYSFLASALHGMSGQLHAPTALYFRGKDTRSNGLRSPAEAKDFSSSPCAQTSSKAHPASYPVGTGDKYIKAIQKVRFPISFPLKGILN
jgi:hypothetical protein